MGTPRTTTADIRVIMIFRRRIGKPPKKEATPSSRGGSSIPAIAWAIECFDSMATSLSCVHLTTSALLTFISLARTEGLQPPQSARACCFPMTLMKSLRSKLVNCVLASSPRPAVPRLHPSHRSSARIAFFFFFFLDSSPSLTSFTSLYVP